MTETNHSCDDFQKLSRPVQEREFAQVTGTSIVQIASGFLNGVARSLQKFDPANQDQRK